MTLSPATPIIAARCELTAEPPSEQSNRYPPKVRFVNPSLHTLRSRRLTKGLHVSEDRIKEKEKFEFTAEGEALGYISLAQARLLAMQTARDDPGDYGASFEGTPMAKRKV